MKSAQEVLKSREEKRQQLLKDNQEQINKELLEFEKALNKYENNIQDEKSYITVEEIIRSKEVKTLLELNGYYIDKVSNDIKVNTTRVYLDREAYNIAVRNKYTGNLNKSCSDKDNCLNNEQSNKLKEYTDNEDKTKQRTIMFKGFPIMVTGDESILNIVDILNNKDLKVNSKRNEF